MIVFPSDKNVVFEWTVVVFAPKTANFIGHVPSLPKTCVSAYQQLSYMFLIVL